MDLFAYWMVEEGRTMGWRNRVCASLHCGRSETVLRGSVVGMRCIEWKGGRLACEDEVAHAATMAGRLHESIN